MAVSTSIKSLMKRLVLGDALAQQASLALCEPQDEIVVWLHGAGLARDVTQLHSVACVSPFTVCIPFRSREVIEKECIGHDVSLELRERGGEQRLLGKIRLKFNAVVQSGGICLALFHVRSCVSYCLPKVHFWAHSLQQEYWGWRDKTNPNVRMPFVDRHAMMVMSICPRPVVVVTTMEGESGNMFPMSLMGDMGDGYFSFALNSKKQASRCVKRAGRVALSSIPFEKAGAVRQLGKQHLKSSVDWKELPFRVKDWKVFGGPVPEFALRVREVRVETVKELGSDTFFVGRVLHEKTFTEGAQFYMVHGMYQRLRAAGV